MLNRVFVLCFLIFTACVSSNAFKSDPLQFSNLKKINIGASSQEDCKKIFGQPDVVVSDKQNPDKVSLEYKSKEGYQRLKLYFSLKSNKLDSILWIPREGEEEAKLAGFYKKYDQTKFHKMAIPQKHPHDVTPKYWIKSDELAITVLNERKDEVGAIGFYDKSERTSASNPNR